MKLATLVLLLTASMVTGVARAEVRDAGEVGFTIAHEVIVNAERIEAWQISRPMVEPGSYGDRRCTPSQDFAAIAGLFL